MIMRTKNENLVCNNESWTKHRRCQQPGWIWHPIIQRIIDIISRCLSLRRDEAPGRIHCLLHRVLMYNGMFSMLFLMSQKDAFSLQPRPSWLPSQSSSREWGLSWSYSARPCKPSAPQYSRWTFSLLALCIPECSSGTNWVQTIFNNIALVWVSTIWNSRCFGISSWGEI